MRRLIAFVPSLVFLSASVAGEPPISFETGSIALLTSEADMSRRTGGSVVALSEYLQKLKSAGASLISNAKDAPKVSGAFVLAVKPGKHSRIWVHVLGEESNQQFIDELASALQAVDPPDVVEGPVVLSVSFRTWPKGVFPIPFVGVAALYRGVSKQSRPMDTDALIKLIWPDEGG